MTHGLYLYGIFPAPVADDLAIAGLDKQPVQTQVVEGFTFLYSQAQQERYLASRRNLLGHEKVLEQAMHQGYRTLLPLQFGLIIDNWDAVAEQLITPHHEGLTQLLKHLDGHREVGIKVFWQEEPELQALMAEDEALRVQRDRLTGRTLGMDEVVTIGQAIEHAMAARKQQIISTFQASLNALAVEIVENEPLTNTMIYNAAYLIPWAAEPDFSAQVEALDWQFEQRLTIRYNEFTAPYNFAQLSRLD
jgi:Gas vesicle synthesis protein GvpL/GvpF